MQVVGEVLSVKRSGLYHHLTLVAPGVPERFRPGTFVAVTVGGAMAESTLRRPLPVHRVRPTGAYGGTVECVFEATDPGTRWLAGAAPGTPVDVVGPLGRPFALPKEPVTCVLVAHGCASAPLFSLAERLRERDCVVHMLLGAGTEAGLFGALEARRATRGVTVATADGSVGLRGGVVDALPDLLTRTERRRGLRRRARRRAARRRAGRRDARGVEPDRGRRTPRVRDRPVPDLRAAGRRRGRRHPDGARLHRGPGVPRRPGAVARPRAASRRTPEVPRERDRPDHRPGRDRS